MRNPSHNTSVGGYLALVWLVWWRDCFQMVHSFEAFNGWASLLAIKFYRILGPNLPLCNFLQFWLFVTEQLGGHSFQFHSVTLVVYLLLYTLYLILCLMKSVFPQLFSSLLFYLAFDITILNLSSIGVFFLFFLSSFFFFPLDRKLGFISGFE